MILSASPLCNALSPTPEPTISHTHLSAESLRLSRSLLLVAGHSLSALGLQLEIRQKQGGDDLPARHQEQFPGVGELLGLLRIARDMDDRGHYLHSAIWRLARGLPHATVYLNGFEQILLHDLDYAEAILHAAREGLLSAARCNADKVWMRLHQLHDWIHLEVEDNGRYRGERSHYQLTGLYTRLNTLSGQVQSSERRADGGKLVVRLPRDELQP